MKIGIDIDEVVVEFNKGFLEFYNKKSDKNFQFEEIIDFGFNKALDLDGNIIRELVKEFNSSEDLDRLELVDGSKEILFLLSKKHDIIFITSRHPSIKERTIHFLNNHFSNFNFNVVFSNGLWKETNSLSKADFCLKDEVFLIIEDNPDFALDCANKGVKVLLLEKPWNKEYEEHQNIIKVKDWNEILENINLIENQKNSGEKNIIEEVRKFVEEECKKQLLGEELFENHISKVVENAKLLSNKFNVDLEVIEIAALFHDIGAVLFDRQNHHITSSKIAEDFLRKKNYPDEKIEIIKKCILNHRGSTNFNRISIEEQIIAEADAMSCFDQISGQFLWVIKKDNLQRQNEITKNVRQKLVNKWNQLSPEAKKLIKPKYEAAMLLFGN
jgi:uncharacterized protein